MEDNLDINNKANNEKSDNKNKSKSEEIFSKLSDFNLIKHLSVIEFQDLLSI